ncbi:hypothetical protein [Dyella sp. 2HG41-7]|uniref:hypothetical protein n=1 Tax=Dyella sp. 2HG41-7 TaxID=2883239 RepID=UPI001F41EFC5|nr:hypothetical protein [Dyella sp. 2HG41-7]
MQGMLKFILLAGVIGATSFPTAFAAQAATALVQSETQQVGPIEAAARQAWRENMAQIATPAEGCFHATYPSILWEQVACKQLASNMHMLPASLRKQPFQVQTAGNGNDYVLQAPGAKLISQTVGSFPSVTGVTSVESVGVPAYGGGGILGPNEYTLQINSQFTSTTPACRNQPGCTVWQQFVYSPDYMVQGEAAVFMEYWLVGYGYNPCPVGWFSDGYGDCVRNSNYVAAPDVPISELGSLALTGTATAAGNDTITFSYGTDAYSFSAKDSVVYLSTIWNQSEFNVVGNAGGSQAVFNSGSAITVNVAANYGGTAKPSCIANAGTTGESNNLNLGPCSAFGGASPYIQFTQSN